MGRARFGARALARLVAAVPRETWSSLQMWRRARRVARTSFGLPAGAAAARSAVYLRSDPALGFMGAYVGGEATHTTGVINGLAANGVDVTVCAARRPEGAGTASHVEVPVRRSYHLARWLALVDYSGDLVRAAEPGEFDFVYQRYALGSYAGLEVARRLGSPLVLEFNGSEIWVVRNWSAGRLPLAGTVAALEDRILREASLIVAVSGALRDELCDRGIPPERVLVNPNGVEVDRLAPYRERPPAEWRRAAGLPEAPTVGFVGTFGLWHGVKLLPAIAGAVAAEAPDARWIVIGDGPLYGEVAAEMRDRGLDDRVTMTGVVEHDRALALLAACDVCVSPHVPNPDGTRFFGSPTKIFEYMGLGKPIVASDLEQIGEVLEDRKTALLCPPGDAAAAAAAVVQLLGDAPLRERLGRSAAETAERQYAWRAHAGRILDALAERGR